MTKAVWTSAAAAAAFLFLASTPVHAQSATDNATVNVSANVLAKAKLTVGGGPVTFADADPTTTPSLTASSAITISVQARTSAAGSVTLTVLAGGDLTNAASNTIPIANLTWTGSGTGYAASGTMNTSAQSVGSWTGSGTYGGGSQTYKLVNSWAYNTGTYTTTLTYTLTAP